MTKTEEESLSICGHRRQPVVHLERSRTRVSDANQRVVTGWDADIEKERWL